MFFPVEGQRREDADERGRGVRDGDRDRFITTSANACRAKVWQTELQRLWPECPASWAPSLAAHAMLGPL